MVRTWKLSPNTATQRLAALRFLYIQVLKRGWSTAETPYPKKVLHLPEILSQQEVARLAILISALVAVTRPSPITRAVSGAKISNRIIFLFDNDTAGHEGYQQFEKVKCPKHYQGLILPYLRSAEAYPTIGPTGDAPANVTACACGIELYCCLKALTRDDRSPCPVQWKGYIA